MTSITTSLKTRIALIITILLWASAFPGIRAGLEGYSPGGMALLRFLVASVCLFIIYLNVKNRPCRIPFKDGSLLLLIGAITIGTYHIALNYGELTVTSGTASFIVSLSPIITILFAVLFLNERVNKTFFLGIFISVVGVGLMTLTGDNLNFDSQTGMLCVLLSAFTSGIYSVLQKPFLKKYHVIDVTSYIMWGATLFLLAFTSDLYHDIEVAPLSATIASVYLGIFPAAIAYLLWTYALSGIPASRVSISMYFLPIIATFLGWVWLREIPTLYSIVGGLAVLIGVWVVNHSYRRMAKTAASAA
jgi:drug/metabolite transporter (DMT)-like permease